MFDDDYPDYYQGCPDIKTITHGRLHSFLKDNDIVMVMYYNPRFGACKAMRPIYQAASQIADRPNVTFAAVNCGKDRDLCIKEGAAFDLPQFKAYASGNKVDELEYTFTMTAQDIARFVEELPVPISASTPNPRKRFY